MYGQCVHTNKWISSFQVPYKKYKVRKKAIPIQRPVVREGCVARIFNFPEVQYGLAPNSPLYSNKNFDSNYQFPKPILTPSQYSVPPTNEPESVTYKKNRKSSGTDGRKAKQTSLSKTASVPNTCLKNELFFPSVDYPMDITDLWTPHYWNRIPQMETEPNLGIIDMTINTKPKKEKTKLAKGSRKESKVNKNLNSCTETKTIATTTALPISNPDNIIKTKQNITDCVYNSKNLTEHRKLPQTPDDFISPTTSDVIMDQKTKDITDETIISEIAPTPDVLRPYPTESTSTTSNIISLLTTVAPTLKDSNENILLNTLSLENTCSTEVENDKEDQLPDDMGYTIMYPELFSSVGTSTVSPFDERIDDLWMYPELDNHTFNSYSDEVEQCYILVP